MNTHAPQASWLTEALCAVFAHYALNAF